MPDLEINDIYQGKKGFDAEWNYAGKQRTAGYSNPMPGKYRLLAKARGDNYDYGTPSVLPAAVQQSVWQTPWMVTLYILTAGIFIFYFIRAYVKLRLSQEKMSVVERERDQEKAMSDIKIKFFTNISHELRTPLTLIYSPVNELMREGINSDKIPYYLSLVEFNTHRLMRLIDQLLDFEKLENDTLSLKVAECDVIPHINNLIGSFYYFAHEKNIEINVDCPYESLNIPVDTDKLEKILTNLIHNALKYTPENGHIWVEIKATMQPDSIFQVETGGMRYLQVNVIDNGTGVGEDELPYLFERYSRFDNKKINALSGTGIGLYYVKKLVETHGGSIHARVRPQGGMSFSFILPLDPEAGSGSADRFSLDASSVTGLRPLNSARPLKSEASGPDRHEYTILITEDNPELRLFLKSILEGFYNVVVAGNGSEAYEKAVEIVPDVVMTDVLMPVMDGYELCRKIKTDSVTSHIPCVILTAKNETDDQIEGYAQGADIYISKPFNVELMLTILDNLLAKYERQKKILLSPVTEQTLDGQSPLDRKFMEKLYKFIDENMSDHELNVNLLGKNLGFSRTSFYRKVKSLTGQTPNDFIRIYRLNRSVKLIREGELPLNEIAEVTGFGTHSHFSTCFKKQFGVSPREFK